jgi:hypothetical protein
MSVKVTPFWDMAPCSLKELAEFPEVRTASIITAGTSETSVYFYETISYS